MQKEMKVFLCVLVVLVLACMAVSPFVFPWIALGMESWFAKPNLVQERGEFPYKLVYRSGGEEYTLEDTIVIEYEDFEYNPEVGEPDYAWNVSLKSDPETAFDGDLLIHQGEGYTVVFSFCSPDHYMGVRVDEQKEAFWLGGEEEIRSVKAERLAILYGIEILDLQLPQPIKK